jgi:hypothetical protein
MTRAFRDDRDGDGPERWFHAVGAVLLVVAVVVFAAGFGIYVSGYEVAFLLLIAALGLFVLGIGLRAVRFARG